MTQRPTRLQQRATPARLWLFDCLHLDGQDLTALPYHTRRRILQELLPGRAGTVAVAPAWSDIDGPTLAEIAAELGVEGTVSKRADSRYLPGWRTRLRIKSSLRHRITLWTAGYAPGRSMPVGALLLAGHDPQTGALRYCGSVAAGLGPRISRALHAALAGCRASTPPWQADPDRPEAIGESRTVWLRPGCSAAIEYREFTAGARFRHLAFKGLVDPVDWVPLPHRR